MTANTNHGLMVQIMADVVIISHVDHDKQYSWRDVMNVFARHFAIDEIKEAMVISNNTWAKWTHPTFPCAPRKATRILLIPMLVQMMHDKYPELGSAPVKRKASKPWVVRDPVGYLDGHSGYVCFPFLSEDELQTILSYTPIAQPVAPSTSIEPEHVKFNDYAVSLKAPSHRRVKRMRGYAIARDNFPN